MIPDEAVEAAYGASTHLDITTSEIERILEAAAPHIIAGYIRETNLKAIAYEIETPLLFKKDPDTPNPYRSQP